MRYAQHETDGRPEKTLSLGSHDFHKHSQTPPRKASGLMIGAASKAVIVCEFFADRPDLVSEAYGFVLHRKAVSIEALAVQRNALLSWRYPDRVPSVRVRDLS
jgi:hypothetical protein